MSLYWAQDGSHWPVLTASLHLAGHWGGGGVVGGGVGLGGGGGAYTGKHSPQMSMY